MTPALQRFIEGILCPPRADGYAVGDPVLYRQNDRAYPQERVVQEIVGQRITLAPSRDSGTTVAVAAQLAHPHPWR